MPRSLKVRQDCIGSIKLSVRRNGFPSQQALAEELSLSRSTVVNFLTGKPVDRAVFEEICQRLSVDSQGIAEICSQLNLECEEIGELPPDPASSPSIAAQSIVTPTDRLSARKQRNWGEAVDIINFYGREQELAQLQQWVVEERCRLITLIGMGGMGKTTLSVQFAKQVQDEFVVVIWRSLRNAPPIQDLLAELIRILSQQQQTHLPETIDGRVLCLLEYLRQERCLLVLDNAESVLRRDERAGAYRDGYEGYGQLFRCLWEAQHQSCLVLTSREKPRGLGAKEGAGSPLRSLRLSGLAQAEGQEILREKVVSVSESASQALIDHYAGNPLALKIAATTIQDVFDGDIAQFLAQGTAVFGDISDLLDQQFERLPPLEQHIMYWLAIEREWVSIPELQQDMIPSILPRSLLEALESLQLRSLIEKQSTTFTQQPVVMEYVTDRLIEQITSEIISGNIDLFNSHALMKAQTKDYLRNAQVRLILKPLGDRLLAALGSLEAIESHLKQILLSLQQAPRQPGYAAGNLLNLLAHLQLEICDYDFSRLTVWQAYLQGTNLHQVNFTGANLSRSVFTQTLGGILSAAFSPDGRLLATGIDCEVCLWQVDESKPLITLRGHTAWVQSIAFSPDGTLLASGSYDHTIRLWNVQTGQCLKTLHGHTSWVQSVSFGSSEPASSEPLILVSGSHDQTVRVWDVQAGDCLQILPGHQGSVLWVTVSPDGQTLISADDCIVRLWDIPTGQCVRTIETQVNWMLAVALSPDGQTLVTGSNGNQVNFWQVATGDCLGTLDYSGQVWAMAFSPDGQMLATASEDQTVKLWQVETGQCLQTLQEHRDRVWLVAFHPHEPQLISISENQVVKLWDTQTGKCLRTLEAYSNWIAAIAFSDDGKWLVTGSQDQQVRLWNVPAGECSKTLSGHKNIVSAVAVAPQSTHPPILASGSDDQTIKVWDAQTGDCLQTLSGHQDWVQSVQFSPGSEILASGSDDRTIKVWDWRTGECLQTLTGHTHRVKSIAFSPQGSLLASGSDDQTIKLWNLEQGTCLQTLQGHQDWVLSVAFSPCGQRFASGSADQTIKVWDSQTGECVRTLSGHTNRVRSIAFSPDGTLLISGSDDQTVRIWQVDTGNHLRTLQGQGTVVWSVTFSPDGQMIVSAGKDERIWFWKVKTGECVRTLQMYRPYEGMKIIDAIGLTTAQKTTLKALGAIEHD
ncbi:MAG: AAA family ATPase [Myxacorys chilensis ATA2-1-KO14]|jgi:WD40 repeat protein|nr:AAA family ATPase [Myxacorys chilensis ATA2-1-KO14]